MRSLHRYLRVICGSSIVKRMRNWMPRMDSNDRPSEFLFFFLRAFLTADCPLARTVLLVSLQALGTMVAIYIPAAPGCA